MTNLGAPRRTTPHRSPTWDDPAWEPHKGPTPRRGPIRGQPRKGSQPTWDVRTSHPTLPCLNAPPRCSALRSTALCCTRESSALAPTARSCRTSSRIQGPCSVGDVLVVRDAARRGKESSSGLAHNLHHERPPVVKWMRWPKAPTDPLIRRSSNVTFPICSTASDQ